MTDLTGLLHRFLSRYRQAVLTRAALLLGLVAGSLTLLGWRLHALRWGPLWSVGLLAALACGAGLIGSWWLRRHWMARGAAAAYLDRTLALQQRLVTAEELADASEPPALYPLLLQDLEERLTGNELQFPRPVDRSTVVLALLLLLLLLWPIKGQTPLQQLASLPKIQPSPQPPSEPPPPEQEEQHTADSTQHTEEQHTAHSTQQTADSAQASGGQRPEQQRQPSGREGAERNTARGSEQPSQERQGAQPAQEARAGERSDQQARGSNETRGSARQGQRQEAQGSQKGGQGSHGQIAAAAPQADTKGTRGQGGGSTPGQEALKGEIQALLKELQGELKQLQAQFQAQQHHAQHEPSPEAGTGSDPELYGAKEQAAVARGETLALQLPTDATPVQRARQSSGVGKPSGEVSRQGPQVAPDETAALSEEPLEEQPQVRAPVPPEYRDVFRKLSPRADRKEPTP